MAEKLRLRIVDGIPEVDGDPDQIMEVLRRLSISQSTQPKPQREERESSNIQDIKEIDSEKLVKIIESSGEPITFSMGDLQKKIYGKRISSRDAKRSFTKRFASRLIMRRSKWKKPIQIIIGKMS